jgi:hypothetical protein
VAEPPPRAAKNSAASSNAELAVLLHKHELTLVKQALINANGTIGLSNNNDERGQSKAAVI